jgi:hypothetical protein
MAKLTLSFKFPPAPQFNYGYTLRYRKVGTTEYTTYPWTVYDMVSFEVEDNSRYEGDLRGDCGDGTFTMRIPWTAEAGRDTTTDVPLGYLNGSGQIYNAPDGWSYGPYVLTMDTLPPNNLWTVYFQDTVDGEVGPVVSQVLGSWSTSPGLYYNHYTRKDTPYQVTRNLLSSPPLQFTHTSMTITIPSLAEYPIKYEITFYNYYTTDNGNGTVTHRWLVYVGAPPPTASGFTVGLEESINDGPWTSIGSRVIEQYYYYLILEETYTKPAPGQPDLVIRRRVVSVTPPAELSTTSALEAAVTITAATA